MHKYGGTLVFRTRDTFGPIEVVEDGRARSLHFGSEPKQSSMDLHNPLRLELTYTRAMATALLFLPQPQRVLLLGLGGGSLAKFLLHYTATELDVVEYRPAVAEVAQAWFALPLEPRLHLHIDDAAHYVHCIQQREMAPYDIALIDAYDAEGLATAVQGFGFIEQIQQLLAREGIAVFNLWADEQEVLEELLADLKQIFGNLLLLPVEGKANLIALVTNGRALRQRLRQVEGEAKQLGQRTGLEFPQLLKQLRKHNRLLLGGLFG